VVAENRRLSSELAAASEKLEEVKEELGLETTKYEAELEGLRSELDALRSAAVTGARDLDRVGSEAEHLRAELRTAVGAEAAKRTTAEGRAARMEAELAQARQSFRSEVGFERSKAAALEERLGMLEEECENESELRKEMAEQLEVVMSEKNKTDTVSASVLEHLTAMREKSARLTSELADARAKNDELMKANRKLEEANKVALKQVPSEKMLKEVESLRKDAASNLEMVESCTALRKEKDELIGIVKDFSPTGDIAEAIERVRHLGKEEANARSGSKPSAGTEKEMAITRELEHSKRETSTMKLELAKARASLSESNSKLQRTEKRCAFLERERTALKSIIDIFEDEGSEGEPNASLRGFRERATLAEASLKSAEQRMCEYEKDLSAKDAAVMKLEKEVAQSKAALETLKQSDSNDVVALQKRLIGAVRHESALSEEKAQLEKDLAELKAKVDAQGVGGGGGDDNQASIIENLRGEVAHVKAVNESLTMRIGSGDFNPMTTKVLHMKDNPLLWARQAAMTVAKAPATDAELPLDEPRPDSLGGHDGLPRKRAREEPSAAESENKDASKKCLIDLEAENRGLKTRISELTESRGAQSTSAPPGGSRFVGPGASPFPTPGMTPQTPAGGGEGAVATLEKALREMEKRAQRTREVAKMKIDELRMVCYMLFGWKITVNGANYTLASMYGERPGDTLCFGRQGNGSMQLLETEYCAGLREEIEQFCNKWNSIPGLLAHITVENFQKTTAFL